jgi:Protein of unknown function (DUF3050)
MPAMRSFGDLKAALASERASLVEHSIYRRLATLEDLRTFMEHHVFAVWDFMSLVKSLQREFTCVDVPWVPRGPAEARRLVNEIVLGEESDEDGSGGYVSHFEMYRAAMEEAGCDTSRIDEFVLRIGRGEPVAGALLGSRAPEPARAFVLSTFETIESRSPPRIAASFTVGREDIIPDLFVRLVDGIDHESGGRLRGFHHYLTRHISIDADRHGPMAVRLLEQLCGCDLNRWAEAFSAARAALRARRMLWDQIGNSVGVPTTSGVSTS